MKRIISLIGRGLASIGRGTIALVGICGITAVLANYAMTAIVLGTFGQQLHDDQQPLLPE